MITEEQAKKWWFDYSGKSSSQLFDFMRIGKELDLIEQSKLEKAKKNFDDRVDNYFTKKDLYPYLLIYKDELEKEVERLKK